MIDQIVIDNFKSLRHADLHLGPLNVFVGPNASGKSNFFDALRFLQGVGNRLTIQQILDGQPRSATHDVWDGIRGGSGRIAFSGNPNDSVRLRAGGSRTEAGRWEFAIEFVPNEGVRFEEFGIQGRCVFRTSRTVPGVAPDVITYPDSPLSGRAGFDPATPFLSLLHPETFPEELIRGSDQAAAEQISFLLANQQRIEPDISRLRSYSQTQHVTRMGEDGENFAALVATILKNDRSRDAYLSWLRQLRPAEVNDIKILTGALGEPMFALAEGKHTYPAPVLSDGTLRFCAIAAALFQPDLPELMLFEEIENGIHASRLRLLVELLRARAAEGRTQIMVTTHSPVVLSWLNTGEHATTFVCKRLDFGESRIVPLTEIPHFQQAIASQPLGDLLTEGWLEAAL